MASPGRHSKIHQRNNPPRPPRIPLNRLQKRPPPRQTTNQRSTKHHIRNPNPTQNPITPRKPFTPTPLTPAQKSKPTITYPHPIRPQSQGQPQAKPAGFSDIPVSGYSRTGCLIWTDIARDLTHTKDLKAMSVQSRQPVRESSEHGYGKAGGLRLRLSRPPSIKVLHLKLLLRLPPLILLRNILPLIIKLLPPRQPNLHLHQAPFQIHLKRH